MSTDTKQTPLTDEAQNRVGDLPFDAELVGKEDMASLELQLAAANVRIAEQAESIRSLEDQRDFASDLLAKEQERSLEKDAQIAVMRKALRKINKWHGEFPSTNRFWDEPKNTKPMSYSAAFGSNGERDFMRDVAEKALAAHASLMTKPRTLEDEFNLPKGSFSKFIEENSSNLP